MTETNGTAAAPPQESLGQSEAFLAFQERLSRVAPVNRPVLIVGERGTGKELAAGRLHFLSRRWQEPLVTLNCAALSPSLIESELFGYEAGAFTGAVRKRLGRFEAAHGGTVFLDEIGNIPLEAQEKILRVVEYGSFERVGGSDTVQVDVRIVGATHADLPRLAAQGKFKQDLLDRLSFEVLTVPPLRVREGDISYLAHFFAARMAQEMGRDAAPTFSEEALHALESHSWPGNIRELKNVVERAVYRTESEDDPASDIRSVSQAWRVGSRLPIPQGAKRRTGRSSRLRRSKAGRFGNRSKGWKSSLIATALWKSGHRQKDAAALLGLTYDQFRGLYRKYRDRVSPRPL